MNTGTIALALSLFMTTPLWSAEKAKTAAADQTLTAGAYTATAKALVCEGCAAFIKETLEKNPSLENISVSLKSKIVAFSVKKNSTLKVSELQAILKTASQEMGMGANYELVDLKPVKSAKS